MRLIRLRLRNFKGLRTFELTPEGEDLAVYGDNATGKTTLMDSWTWILFGKDSENRAEFEIKTLGPDGQPIHNLEHDVEAEVELENGRRLRLRKVYQEKWTKRRGQVQREFAGHTTDHYIDGVPAKKAEYDALIASIADEQRFRLLTDPTYFNVHMHWQDRRKLLLEVCGDVTDEDVIASDPELAEMPKILGGRTLDDHRKVITARRTEINKELDRIPVRIDEVRRGLPDIPDGASREGLESDLRRLRERRGELEAERVRIQAGGEVAELTKRLREVEAEILAAERRLREVTDQALRRERSRLSEVQDELDAKQRELRRLEGEHRDAEAELHRLEDRMRSLRDRWHEINDEAFAHAEETTCPACGQPLPEERVREAWEKAVAAYNADKSRRLEEVSAEGKAMKARYDDLAGAVSRLEPEITRAREDVQALETMARDIQENLDRTEAASPGSSQDPEVQRLRAQQEELQGEIARLRAGSQEALAGVDAKIRDLNRQIAGVEAAISQVDQRERGLARIAELEAEEKRLAQEFERLERELHLTDLFVRSKVRLLEERINSRFALARFQLFRVLVNGGVEECCETTVNGVPYGSLNHGARIQAGLDIVRTLQEHYSFYPPVWCDNRESVTSIPEMPCQVISLFVSAADQELRVEVAEGVAVT